MQFSYQRICKWCTPKLLFNFKKSSWIQYNVVEEIFIRKTWFQRCSLTESASQTTYQKIYEIPFVTFFTKSTNLFPYDTKACITGIRTYFRCVWQLLYNSYLTNLLVVVKLFTTFMGIPISCLNINFKVVKYEFLSEVKQSCIFSKFQKDIPCR